MFDKILEPLVDFFLGLGESYGYIAIFFGAMADALIPIIPSEVVFGAAGFWATKGYIFIPFAVLVAVAGNAVATSIFWYLGKKYGHDFLENHGKYLNFSHNDLARAEKTFAKWGYWAVFVCQFIPLIRSLISIPSGILELNYKKFITATSLGSVIWSSLLITVAYNLGERWLLIADYLTTYGKPVTILVLILVVIAAIWYYFNYKQTTNKAN